MNIISNNTFLLRLAVSTILVFHGLGEMFNGGINGFGEALNGCEWGICLAPLGIPIAWAIKLSHLVCVFSLLSDKYVKTTSLITIFHFDNGYYSDSWQKGMVCNWWYLWRYRI